MKVLIAGAGIGGLSAAIAFQNDGHEVYCFDRVREMRPIGAAISVWSNGVKVLNRLGLNPQAYSGQMDRMNYCDFATGEPLCDFSLEPLYTKVKMRACPIARTDLQKILYDGAGHDKVTLNKGVTNYEATEDGITITFADGTTESGDFLVIADGTHSRLRNKICGKTIERQYVGYINFNMALPQSALKGTVPATTWTQFVGEGKRVSIMPMSEERFYIFFDCTVPKGTATDPHGIQEELRQLFKGWTEAVQILIDNIDVGKVARVEIHDTDTLPTLIDPSGRAVLIGDAAHATAPDLGQGGCLAMEDSFVIANLFKKAGITGSDKSNATPETFKKVVSDYQEERGKRVGDTVLRARKRAAVTHGYSPEVTAAWYEELRSETGENIMAGMSKTILGLPKELNDDIQPVVGDGTKPLVTAMADAHS